MKKLYSYFILVVYLLFYSCTEIDKTLIPAEGEPSFSYFQTWILQNVKGARGVSDTSLLEGSQGAFLARQTINEELLFGKTGCTKYFDPSVRKQLILVLDDGWDVPFDGSPDYYGCMELDSVKFPSFTGDPAVRLEKLNNRILSQGWKGTGLWICAQEAIKDSITRLKFRSFEDYRVYYWTKRLEWCKNAGILYWKVDWGKEASNQEFRRFLSELAKKVYPALIVEHGLCTQPYNDTTTGRCNYSTYKNWFSEFFTYSDVVRSYDVTSQLSVSTTLDRVYHLISNIPDSITTKGLINIEDELYVGAALGLPLGIMRFPLNQSGEQPGELNTTFFFGKDYKKSRYVLDNEKELSRAVNWQKIMPPFKVNASQITINTNILYDSWTFNRGDIWDKSIISNEIKQGAPSVISRNMPLPKVIYNGEPPFVISCRHPNGNISVATFGRVSSEKGYYFSMADVTLSVTRQKINNIGVFGYYNSLTLQFNVNLDKVELSVQDLAGGKVVDITSLVEIKNDQIIIPGAVINDLCRSSEPKDKSEPGVIIQIS